MNDASTPSAQNIGARFNLVAAIPATTLVAFTGAILATGAPFAAPSPHRAANVIERLGVQEIGLLLFATVIVALVLQPFQVGFVKLLEGYGPQSGPLAPLRRFGLRRYEALFDYLEEVFSEPDPDDGHAAQAFEIAERRDRAEALLAELPRRSRLMPTRLGNTLRRAEDLAGRRYGLDAVEVIPRLFPLMASTMTDIINDARDEVDVMASLVLVWSVATVIALITLFPYGAWVLVGIATYALACVSYRGCIVAARAYGETLSWAIDLYRFDLYDQLRIQPPREHTAELEYPDRLTDFLKGDWALDEELVAPWNPRYQHPQT